MKTLLIPISYKEFEYFHDKEWFVNFFNIIDSTVISDIGNHFTGNLYGATRSFFLPMLIIDSIFHSTDGKHKKQHIWEELTKLNSFNAAVGKNSENCFVSLFCSYEDFILQSTRFITNKNKLKLDSNFSKMLSMTVGKKVASKAWNNNKLSLAKEIRHCIVHNEGRVSHKLLNQQNLPEISKGNIFITPREVRNLCSVVKESAYLFAEKITKLR